MADESKIGAQTADNHRYSIRVAEKAGVLCAISGHATGAGPVAYRDEEPICDLCALDVCGDLGLVLALVAVTRAFGAVRLENKEASHQALAQLGAFARVFEHVMGKRWGRREVGSVIRGAFFLV